MTGTDDIHRAPENNQGHLSMAYQHLLRVTPEGMDRRDWSRVAAAFDLLGQLRDEAGADPMLMEEYRGDGPRRYRCDSCGSEFLASQSASDDRETTRNYGIMHKNPDTCPFCPLGTPTLVEGREEVTDDAE